jgi:glyoxylase-like metal-dependent hydrolase (beta-lactamase superfamily II)
MKAKIWFRCSFVVLLEFLVLSNIVFAQTLSKNQSIVKTISEGIYLVNVSGYAITIIDGTDGLLVIDTGYYPGKLDSVISTLFNHPVKYILNTHYHTDHIMDNKMLVDKGAVLIANENSRDVLAAGWNLPEFQSMKILPVSADYLPKICFRDTLDLYFNDNIIQAIHYPAAHTVGDAIYYFKNKNLVVTGDLFVLYGPPYIDYSYGGTFSGFIKAVENILSLCDDKTVLIPGHGEISNKQGLLEYRDKLLESKKIIAKLVYEGKSLDEIIRKDTVRYIFNGRKAYDKDFITAAYKELKK